MPSAQRGQVFKLPTGSWAYRLRGDDGRRPQVGGFPTKGAASAALDVALRDARNGRLGIRRNLTFRQLVGEYLAQHTGEQNTLRTLEERLRYATATFGDVPIDRLDPQAIGLWRKRLPERSAWGITKALRQVLGYAVRVKLLDENVAQAVPNPESKRREVPAFESPEQVDAVAAELSPQHTAIPIVAAWTGLRPSELLALERGDIDRTRGVLHFRRVYVDGQVKLYGKQRGSLRAVPLPLRAAVALSELPVRLDNRLLFPGVRGGYLNLHEWRRDEWTPALRAAGLAHRGPYALLHTFAAWSIAAGIGLFELARLMGTSVEQIDKTYGHLLPDSLDRARTALDTFAGRDDEAVAR